MSRFTLPYHVSILMDKKQMRCHSIMRQAFLKVEKKKKKTDFAPKNPL